ncbi:acylaminoacyl-peptidase [Coprinopsis sp. MPI-PUGE-AT-0042]|nr:acylaminoacyl-peptidase [Coprinopsis sp. MPI-PUGE-AT-0042]
MYTELAEIPVPVGGQFLGPNADAVEIVYSVRDHELNTKKTIIKTIANITEEKVFVSPPTQVDGQVASLYAPSGIKRVVLREVPNPKGGDKKKVVEFWRNNVRESTMDVSELHDAFYADEYLGSLAFNQTEDLLVYVAECKPPETKDDPYAKFRFRPDFGEGLTGKRRPGIFVSRWPGSGSAEKASAFRLETPDAIRFGQPVFSTFSTQERCTLYATGYELQVDGRLLGVKGCFNRPSGIWKIEVDLPSTSGEEAKTARCKATKLTDEDVSCRSPRVIASSDDEERLLFFSSPSGGPHVSTTSLNSYLVNRKDGSVSATFLGNVDEGTGDYRGLSPPYNLATSPYLSGVGNPGSIVLHSNHGSKTLVFLIGLDGRVINLDSEFKDELWSWSVLATDSKSKVLCWRSTLSVPYELGILDLKDHQPVWKVLDKPHLSERVTKALKSVDISIKEVTDRKPTEVIILTSSLNKRDDGKVPPCILVPHGGPHATTTTAFSAASTALVLEGYTLAFPNYTGSLGYGEHAVRDLIGECGRRDVDDCIGALDYLVKAGLAEEGPGRLFIQGGSHGGFLTGHLIGQFPDRFTAAVFRNPVISGETSTTDIPDWYFSEFGFGYPIASSSRASPTTDTRAKPPLMIGETYAKLETMSPMYYVDKVKVPVLLLIGLSDRRVAPTHGIEYYHALKARGQEVEMLTFEGESHPLEGVECSRVHWEAGRDWFNALRK